jgi:hypothetical protein
MNRRDVVFITATAVLSMGLIAWLKNRSATPAPAAVNSYQPAYGSTVTPGDSLLNMDWESYLFPTSTAVTAATYPKPGATSIMSRGISNNNPLNIEANGIQWQGLTGSDGRFAIFDTAQNGIRAAARIMKTYRDSYGINTVRGIVSRWAPPSDNNPTESYINYVANAASVSADAPLGAADYVNVITAMIQFENGYQPYENSLIKSAVIAGLS